MKWFRKRPTTPPIDIDDLIKPPRVIFEGYEGDTSKLRPIGVKRNDKILSARADLGVGMPPPRFLDRFLNKHHNVVNIDARGIVEHYRSRKVGR